MFAVPTAQVTAHSDDEVSKKRVKAQSATNSK
jgi:hypothetical protein